MSDLSVRQEALFVAEGTLSHVQHARGTVNLLAEVDKNVRSRSLGAGSIAVLGDMHGMVANAAMLAMYDGEDVYNFAALLGEQVVCGTFESADAFQDGDRVRAVVSRCGDVLRAHAVLRTDDNLLFMPVGCHLGVRAVWRRCTRQAWKMTLIAWVALACFWWFFFEGSSAKDATLQDVVLIVSASVLGPLLAAFGTEYWTYRTARPLGEYTSSLLRALGFARADDLDLSQHLTSKRAPANPYRGLSAFNCDTIRSSGS